MSDKEKINNLTNFINAVQPVLNNLRNQTLQREAAVTQMTAIINAHRVFVLDAINGAQLRADLKRLAQNSLVAIRDCLIGLDANVGLYLYDAADIANVLGISDVTGRRAAVGMFLNTARLYLRGQNAAIGAQNHVVAGGNTAVNVLVAIVNQPPAFEPVVLPVNVVEDDDIAAHPSPAKEPQVELAELVEGVANVGLSGEKK